jgi:2-keto-3-deoxy-L-rhamnonate aldolase RhmA
MAALPFARVPINELWTAKRVLDAGVAGVIFPFTNTPQDAKQAAASCRYPPHGERGSGAGNAMFTWPGDPEYYDCADSNILVVTVVEDVRALESIDEITSTEGVDVVFIGVSDLSFSLGLRGQQDVPELHRAIDKIVAACKRNNKVVGRPAGSPEALRRFQEQGFRFFQGPTEIGLLNQGGRGFLEPLGKSRQPGQRAKSLY